MKKLLKIIRKGISITLIILGGCFMYFVAVLWYGFYQEHKSILIGMQNVEGAKVNAERTAKIHEIATIVKDGTKFDEEGKYDLAIEQYKKALNESRDNLDIWIARCALADSYTKSEQYELALEEINWIISQNPRKEVMDEYLIRKQLLEKLIEGKKAVNVTDLDHTAFLVQ